MDTETRVPLSITLRKDLLAFVLRCAESEEIGSLDQFFDTAVEVFQMHLDALLECIDGQKAKGLVDDDIAGTMKCEVTSRRRNH